MSIEYMEEDPVLVKILFQIQNSGADFCRVKFSAGGTLRIYTNLFGIKRAQLEEKLRWALPEWYTPIVIEEKQ